MMTLRMGENPRALGDTAGFRITRPVIQARNPRAGNRAGAHRTGLQRDVKIVAHKPLAALGGTGRAQREDLRMGRGVVQFARAIARLRNDLTIWIDHHGPHWHLAAQGRGARLVQRCHHMAFERHVASLPRHRHFRKSRE